MFVARIEKKAGTGLNHAAELERFQQVPNGRQLLSEVAVKRIERVIIERKGDALIAQCLKNNDCVAEIMMGEAVGVVAEEHGAW